MDYLCWSKEILGEEGFPGEVNLKQWEGLVMESLKVRKEVEGKQEILKAHMDQLHDYNDYKDIAQVIFGKMGK